MNTIVRDAHADDLALYTRLFVELGLDEPAPARLAELLPGMLVAERGSAQGFVLSKREGAIGHIRQIVVDPSARRTGLGRALMLAATDRLRAQGANRFWLNVKTDNAVAIALYETLGFRRVGQSAALWIDRSSRLRLPCGGPFVVYAPRATDDSALERAFDLPFEQLSQSRAHGSVIRAVRASSTNEALGLMRYSPSVPGAYPFCARTPEVARALLGEAEHLTPAGAARISLVVASDSLDAALVRAGATLRFRMLQMERAV